MYLSYNLLVCLCVLRVVTMEVMEREVCTVTTNQDMALAATTLVDLAEETLEG